MAQARWTPQEWTPVRSCGMHGQLPNTLQRLPLFRYLSGESLASSQYKLTEPQRIDATPKPCERRENIRPIAASQITIILDMTRSEVVSSNAPSRWQRVKRPNQPQAFPVWLSSLIRYLAPSLFLTMVQARWTPQEWTPVRSCGMHGQLPNTLQRLPLFRYLSGESLASSQYKLTEPQRVDATPKPCERRENIKPIAASQITIILDMTRSEVVSSNAPSRWPRVKRSN
jgi:hypothetical protein